MRLRIVLAIATVAVVAAGCSTSAQPEAASTSAAPTTSEPTTTIAPSTTTKTPTTTLAATTTVAAEPVAFDLEMIDFSYEPALTSIARGAEVTITAMNGSPFGKHDLVIIQGVFSEFVEIKNAMEADPSIVVGEVGLVDPGESGSLVVTFDEPGEYQFFCTVTGHFVAGMQGTIEVEG